MYIVYHVGSTAMNWTKAQEYCQALGSNLATITSTSDIKTAKALCQTVDTSTSNGYDGCWIGLYFNDTISIYQWADHSELGYGFENGNATTGIHPWYPGQPNNASIQKCIHLWDNGNFTWDDNFCNDLEFPICNDVITTTIAPSNAPSYSPTTCYDHDEYTNDGYEQNVNEIIMNMEFDNIITDNDKIIIASNFAQYNGKTIKLQNDNKQELRCNSLIGCNGANIIFQQNSHCNLLCDGQYSCAHATVDISGCDEAQIICNGINTCNGLDIQITSHSGDKLEIFCGNTTSCNNMEVNIIGNVHSNISCIGLYACDGLRIDIESDHYQTNFLNMYSYSKNVTYSNGHGFETENRTNPTKFVNCNTDNHYIEWNASQDISDRSLRETVLSEYIDNRFPCHALTVECFADVNDTSSCDMDFDIDLLFNITNPVKDASCYWVSVSDLIDMRCNGDCVTSPTQEPTLSPSKAPTTDPTTTEPTSTAPTTGPSTPPTTAAPTAPQTTSM